MRNHLYALARVHERRGNWEAASNVYRNAMLKDNNPTPEAQYRLGHALFRLDQNNDAITWISRAISARSSVAEWHYRLAFILEREHRYNEAVESYVNALVIRPDKEAWEKRLAGCQAKIKGLHEERLSEIYLHSSQLKKQNLLHSAIQHLRAAISENPDSVGLLKRLAESYELVQEYGDSALYYERAAHLTTDANYAFLAGYAFSRNGKSDKAQDLYRLALEFEGGESHKLGIGVFFQRRGLWEEAAQHYTAQLAISADSGDLLFRLGFSYDRMYDWDSAAKCYKQALALDPNRPYLYYRLGFVCERSKNYSEASEFYAIAASYEVKERSFWAYRLGYCLAQTGRFEAACHAFLSSEPALHKAISEERQLDKAGVAPAPVNMTLNNRLNQISAEQRAKESFKVSSIALKLGDYDTAASALRMLISSNSAHNKEHFFHLGYAEYRIGSFRSAAQSFKQMRSNQSPHGVDTGAYNKDKSLKEVMSYTELCETLPLQPDIILYESSHGDSVNCNPYAIFEEICKSDHESFLHVWVCNDITKAPLAVRNHKRVILVTKGSYLYLRHLATAKYLINNTSFPTYFIRRDGQKYLNTWHGTPLKTLGKDVKTGFFEHRNITRNLLQASHLLAPNMHTHDALLKGHEVEGLFTGEVAITGYPRVDKTLLTAPDRVRTIRESLGIDSEDNYPVVLYAPTWRGGIGTSHFDTEQLKQDLDALQGPSRHVFFRAHRFAEAVIKESGLSARVVPPDLDTNDLLAAVDVLVTDYSSIFFDYLPLSRPIIFYVPDLEAYEQERGLYLRIEDMPGETCHDTRGLNAALDSALTEWHPQPTYDQALATFCPMDDGHAAKRAISFFFEDSTEHVVAKTKDAFTTILFRQSLIPNGITSSFISLVSELDSAKYRMVLLFDANFIENDPERLRLFGTLPSYVQRVARSGRQAFTAEEKWLDTKFDSQGYVHNDEQMSKIAESSGREFRRIFGTSPIDHVCEFDGYSRFWASILAHGGSNVKSRVIYMHNELEAEYRMKHPKLGGVFELYKFFDRLVSVSESVMTANCAALSARANVSPEKFVYANNVVSASRILSLSKQGLPAGFEDWAGENSRLIVTMGRLSPEKGQERLIREFAACKARYPDLRLAIIGEGGLRPELEQLITQLGLQESVVLLGLLENPFPLLARADGFILPSLHEGQGLALLEAMILGTPVVATDIPGPRSLLSEGHGMLVANSEDGIRDGLDYLANDTSSNLTAFDVDLYQKEAIWAFEANLS